MTSIRLLALLVGSAEALRLGAPVMRVQEGLKLALDIKGNPSWDLRVATSDDAAAISKMMGGRYTTDVLAPLLTSQTCIVGESGAEIITAALVTTFKGAPGVVPLRTAACLLPYLRARSHHERRSPSQG